MKPLMLSLLFLSFSGFKTVPLTVGSADSTLSDNRIIKSEVLGYDLQYRVYLPPNYEQLNDLSVIYLADGQWYISEGDMPNIMDELISKKQIKPLIAVFIDNRDPHNLSNNRRNSQFLCNEKYVQFAANELVPHIDKTYKTAARADARAIMGLSFGGLNAAYFGLKANDTFGKTGMQSPALHPCPSVYTAYQKKEILPLQIYLSTGSSNDTEVGTRKLKRILDAKGYDFEYKEVNQGHNWSNWKPLIDDVLIYFFNSR
ncbi:MAG: alpha/beta hydrolase-fold protein [Bacteroidota bacterium]